MATEPGAQARLGTGHLDRQPSGLCGALPSRRRPRRQVMSLSEQIVACEAYDFKRWTGCVVASHVLRDAYDEYNGFE